MRSRARELPFRYRYSEDLGRGATGRVVRAIDRRSRRVVAIKILERDTADTEALFRFVREQGIRLDHPNIVAVQDFVHRGDHPLIVMEFVAGGTLAERLRQGFDLTPSLQRQFAAEALQALAFIHQQGIIHRDIKPSNIMVVDLDHGPHPKLGDFGLALALDEPRLTSVSRPVGTTGYIAPEVLRTGESDERSDLFALGLVLQELLDASSRPDREVARVASILTERDPEDRPRRAEDALGSLIGATPDLTDQLVTSAQEIRSVNHTVRRRVAPALVLAAVAVIAALGLAAWPSFQPDAPTTRFTSTRTEPPPIPGDEFKTRALLLLDQLDQSRNSLPSIENCNTPFTEAAAETWEVIRYQVVVLGAIERLPLAEDEAERAESAWRALDSYAVAALEESQSYHRFFFSPGFTTSSCSNETSQEYREASQRQADVDRAADAARRAADSLPG